MARVKATDTRPEMIVRRLVHSMGYRYRLHVARLAGKPDLVFASRRKVIFVNGCFWHLHAGCSSLREPKSRTDFWSRKLQQNAERDARVQRQLASDGWDVLVVWECELADLDRLGNRLSEFLERRGGA